MRLTIRLAALADASVVARLIDMMDREYNGAANVPADRPTLAMVEKAIGTNEGARFAIAFDGDESVGVACFGVLRPGYRLAGLAFLKDLYVVEAMRSHGIGRALMRFLARFALAEGIGRIDLTTAPSNIRARTFYDRLGGKENETIMVRYDGEALRRLADDCAPAH